MASRDEKTSTITAPFGSVCPQGRRAYLIMIAGSDLGRLFELRAPMVVGRGPETDIRLLDDFVSRRHACITPTAGGVVIEDLDSHNGTFVNGVRVDRAELNDGDRIAVGRTTILKFTLHDEVEEAFQRRLFDSASTDGLTGVANKTSLLSRLDVELAYALRHHVPLALLMVDVDNLKQINDAAGHLAGDAALVTIAHLIRQSLRCEDLLARYGGDEFAILARGNTLEEGAVLAERLRRSVDEQAIEFEGTELKATISVGVAVVADRAEMSSRDLISAADRALYDAKRGGRNRVCVSGEPSTTP
jgi:two-component system, cell cycle response regulator